MERLEAGEEFGVSGEGVVALGSWGLRVPGVPDTGREVVRHVTTGDGVVESALHDDGAGADVGEHVGDAPLGRVTGAGQVGVAHPQREFAQPGDGGAQGVEVTVSHW